MATGIRTVKIRFDGTAAGFIKAAGLTTAALKGVEREVDKVRKGWQSIPSVVGAASKMLAKAALVVSSFGGGVGAVIAVTSALAAMSGAAGIAVPALFGLVGVMAAIKLGGDGIKKAFEPLGPTIDRLKVGVSAAFEKSLKPAVNDLKGLLPQVSGGLRNIATELGGVASRTTAMLKTSGSAKQLNTIFTAMSLVIRNIGKFLAPVIAAFIKIGAVAAPIMVELTNGFGAVGDRFKAFIDRVAASGQLEAWIRGGIDAVRQFVDLLKNIGGIVADVFGAASAAGLGFGGTLGTVVQTVRDFTSSLEGQTALKSFFEAVRTIGEVVSKVLMEALKAVAPVIPPLAQAFSQLATAVGAALVPAIRIAGPILQGLAQFLSANMAWLAPVAIAIGAVALAVQAVTTAIKLWQAAVVAYTVVQWALNAAMTANPIGLVIAAIAALIAIIVLIVMNIDWFRGIWDTVWKWASDLITTVVDWIQEKWAHFWQAFDAALGILKSIWDSVWGGVRDFFGTIINWIVTKAEGFGRTLRSVFDGIGNFIGGVWDGIKSGFKSAINGVISFANGAIRGINAVSGAVGIPSIPQIPQLAKGGIARAGKVHLVGEEGPELFRPGRTGRIDTASDTAKVLGGGGEVPTIKVFIGNQEIKGIVRVELEESTMEASRSVRSGSGGYR